MNIQLTLTTFTPGEAERITGVTTWQQRDWRRRGHLPSSEGRARFNAFDICDMWVLRLLSERGIGPKEALEVMPWCARGIVWHALNWTDAYEGDHDRVFEWQPEIFAEIRKAKAAAAIWVERLNNGEITPKDLADDMPPTRFGGATQREYIRRQLWQSQKLPRIKPTQFFIWWANGDHTFHPSLDKAFKENLSGDARYAGLVGVLDLNALGSTLLDRAGRPLLHVEIITSEVTASEPEAQEDAPA